MTDTMQQTAAVLDEMVAGIMGAKAAKSARLTPVGLEVTPPIQQFAPLESPYSGLEVACARMRSAMSQIDKYLGAIERDAQSMRTGTMLPSAQPSPLFDDLEVGMTKAIAAKPFPDYAELQRAAQAAVFTSQDAALVEPPKWTCSTHGDDDLRSLTSARGRQYMACGVPNCKEFQR